MLEKHIQKNCLDYLRLKKIFCFKLNNTGIYKQSTGSYIPSTILGLPDICLFYCGEVVFLEIKNEKGKLSEHQIAFQKQCEKDKIIYKVIRSLDELMEWIK